jgi:putative ATP-dependent endonuclease of OLD family
MWFQNPGGIPVVVLARLPRYIVIQANTAIEEMTGSGVLPKILNELFEDVRNTSSNYKEAQRLLNELAEEMDPSDSSSEFGKMLSDLNAVMASVFPDSKIHARADLSDPDKSLKPTFTVELQSNIRTPVDHQGAGMVRSAVFGILRFRQKWLSIREDHDIKRSIIIGFEEPEMYLHPSAANQMRGTIYELSNQDSQIVATTHSPFLIDLSRKPRQVLNRFSFVGGSIKIQSFNVTEVFKSLQEENKDYVKMLLKIDDYVARVLFAKHVVIVEGDTEEVVIRETLRCLTPEKRLEVLANTEIVKARGKASIIGLVKYLKAMGIIPTVIHDRDAGVKGAEVFNGPIKTAVGEDNVILLCECIEDFLGYDRTNREKPYAGYSKNKEWMNGWEEVPAQWRSIIEKVFKIK